MRILNARPGAIWCCVALFILSAAGLNADPLPMTSRSRAYSALLTWPPPDYPNWLSGCGPGGWVWPAVHYLLPRTRMVTQTAYIG